MSHKIFRLALLLILAANSCIAQSTRVTRTIVKPSENGKSHTIVYDLVSKKPCKIEVDIIYRGSKIENPRLSGQGTFGDCITGGVGKIVIWDNEHDIPNWSGKSEDFEIKVNPVMYKRNRSMLFGGVGLLILGSSISYLGIPKIKSALDDYLIYKYNTDPGDLWGSKGRTEFYNSVNRKYKESQYIIIGGGSIIALGATLLINRKIKLDRDRKGNCSINSSTQIQPSICYYGSFGAGFRLVF